MKIFCQTCKKVVMEQDGKFCRVLLRREEDAIVIDCPRWFFHRDCGTVTELSTEIFLDNSKEKGECSVISIG